MRGRAQTLALLAAGIGITLWQGRARGQLGRSGRTDGPGVSVRGTDEPDGRGRGADQPSEIPPRGWKDVLVRTWKEFSDDQIPMIAAGVAFFSLLAIFPGIAAFVALYGLFADVADAQRHVGALAAILPGGAIQVIGDQVARLAAAKPEGLSLAFGVGLLTAIWSANGAMKSMITGLNVAYDEKERRRFVRKTVISLALTAGFLVFALAAAGVMALPGVIGARFGRPAEIALSVGGWTALVIGLVLALAFLYRYGPSRDLPRWRWISWGSAVATLAWLAMSVGFTLYVANFGNYDKTYGSLGAVVGFMTWLWLSAMVVLLGAELNAEIEHQTAKDTTVGSPRPLGARGAEMADTVGPPQ